MLFRSQGRAALEVERDAGVGRILRGVATDGRRPAREGSVVRTSRGEGVVTSGNFSPVLGHGIALAFVDPAVTVGDAVEVEVRGSVIEGRVVETPFVKKQASGA